MVKPTLAQLMEKENVNRYALVVATAKCAREITDELARQKEYVEKNGGKDADKNAAAVINPRYRDERAVQNAIEELYNDEYRIVKSSLPEGMGRDYVRPEPEEETAEELDETEDESPEEESEVEEGEAEAEELDEAAEEDADSESAEDSDAE